MSTPDFMVIGAMKCATTSLCDLFASHPEIFVCDPKEPEYFCRHAPDQIDIADYQTLFSGAIPGQITGEGSTSYTKYGSFPGVAAKIKTHAPDCRLIYIMRDPIRRIESHWMHTIRTGHKPIDFALLGDQLDHHYIDTSLYWRQISQYRKHYSDDQILLLFYEDFVATPDTVLEECYRFLGVNADFRDTSSDEARHVSVGSRVDRPLVGRLQQFGLLRSLAQLIPRKMRDAMKRPFQLEISERPRWERESLEKVLGRVREDAVTVLRHAGKPDDFWALDVDKYLDS